MDLYLFRYSNHALERIDERVGAENRLDFLSRLAHDPDISLEIFRGRLKKKKKREGTKWVVALTAKDDLHVLVQYLDKFYVLICDACSSCVVTVLSEKDYRCKSWAVNLSPFIDVLTGVSERVPEVAPTKVLAGYSCLPVSECGSAVLVEGDSTVTLGDRTFLVRFPGSEKALRALRAGNSGRYCRGAVIALGRNLNGYPPDKQVYVIAHGGDRFTILARAFLSC